MMGDELREIVKEIEKASLYQSVCGGICIKDWCDKFKQWAISRKPKEKKFDSQAKTEKESKEKTNIYNQALANYVKNLEEG